LVLTTSLSRVSNVREIVRRRLGRGSKAIAAFESGFDAVCEAPGGRIHPLYTGGLDIFWRYPNTRRRAILFHSIEPGIIQQPATRQSVAQADLIIARSNHSATVARNAGADSLRVIESCDIVLGRRTETRMLPGLAVALRVPNIGPTNAYFGEIRSIFDYLETLGKTIDYARMESPMGEEQIARGYGSARTPDIGLWADDKLYNPFTMKRDGIISCRLHTTLLAILAGNRKILQFQIESETNKTAEILEDIGLTEISVLPIEQMKLSTIQNFVEFGNVLEDETVNRALVTAQSRVEGGLDAFEEWLFTI
jgi:hypothetical protein